MDLFKCPDFIKMTPRDRFEAVKELSACVNCTSIKHRVSSCQSNTSCRRCRLKHHTMLCFNQECKVRELNRPPPVAETVGTTNEPLTLASSQDSHASRPAAAVLRTNKMPTDVALCTTSIAASHTVLQTILAIPPRNVL